MKEKGFWESGRGWKERPCHAISFSAGRKDRGQRPIGERIANVVTLTGRLPFVMLQTKPLQDLLSQALSPSIHTAVLATPQGTLITHSVVSLPNSSFTETEARRRHTRSLGAIATAIWKSYATINNVDDLFGASNGTSGEAERRDGLVWLSIECENGRLLIYQIPSLSKNGLILVLEGPKDAPTGMMRAKVLPRCTSLIDYEAELIAQYLEQPLRNIDIDA